MLRLTGYLDRISARPGEQVAVGYSSQLPRPYRADLVRIRSANPNAAGPGMQIGPVPSAFATECPSRDQPVRVGSCAVVPAPGLVLPTPCKLIVRVQPGLLDKARVALAADGLVLRIVPEGTAVLHAPVVTRRWYELRACSTAGRSRCGKRSWNAHRTPATPAKPRAPVFRHASTS